MAAHTAAHYASRSTRSMHLCKEDVGGLEVTMDDAGVAEFVVQVIHPSAVEMQTKHMHACQAQSDTT